MEQHYQYSRNAGYDKSMKLGEYARLRFFSKKAFKRENPKGSYKIVGAIGEGLTKPMGEYLYGFENHYYYSPKQSALGHKTVGYIQVGDGEYFSVIKKTKRVIFSLLAVLILVLALAGFLYMEKVNSIIDSSVVDFTPPEGLEDAGSANSIAIPGYGKIYIEAGTKDADLTLWNPKNNPCYFRYTMFSEDGEELYVSGLIPPGKAVTEVELSERIPEGEHPVTLKIDTFSLEDHETPLNGGAIECTLIGFVP